MDKKPLHNTWYSSLITPPPAEDLIIIAHISFNVYKMIMGHYNEKNEIYISTNNDIIRGVSLWRIVYSQAHLKLLVDSFGGPSNDGPPKKLRWPQTNFQ